MYSFRVSWNISKNLSGQRSSAIVTMKHQGVSDSAYVRVQLSLRRRLIVDFSIGEAEFKTILQGGMIMSFNLRG